MFDFCIFNHNWVLVSIEPSEYLGVYYIYKCTDCGKIDKEYIGV
jgi:hypothetical protein